MKRLLVLFFVVIVQTYSHASEITTRVKSILSPERPDQDYLLLSWSDGRVYKVGADAQDLLEDLKFAKKFRRDVLISADEQLNLHHVEVLPEREIEAPAIPKRVTSLNAGFKATKINSWNRVNNLYVSLRDGSYKESQCFQRAHYWSYEMWKREGVKSMKAFLFFTQRYIREYNYGWWFHVAPFLQYKGQEIVLDNTFSSQPQEINVWKNDYVHSHRRCPTVKKYSDYENHQESEHCYFMKTSMYYFQPLDMENFEHSRSPKTSWVQWELNAADGAFWD